MKFRDLKVATNIIYTKIYTKYNKINNKSIYYNDNIHIYKHNKPQPIILNYATNKGTTNPFFQ
jgi:hypothetical protein